MYNSRLLSICDLTVEKKSPHSVGSENGLFSHFFWKQFIFRWLHNLGAASLCTLLSELEASFYSPLLQKVEKTKHLVAIFLFTPLCHKKRVKTKHQNENFHFSYRCTISPPPVYALFRYLLCLFITPLCYGLRFKNDSSWRNSSHLPIAQTGG